MTYRNKKGRFAKRRTPDLRYVWLVGGMILYAIVAVASDAIEQLHQPIVYAAEYDVEIVEPRTVLIEVEIDWTEERIKKEVWSAAAKYNTFPEKMWNVMLCENTNLIPDLQSHHTYNFSDPSRGIYAGEREQSYGLAQIHLPDHDVTLEQAIDPVFAIDFMAKHFAKGNASWWTCYKKLYR